MGVHVLILKCSVPIGKIQNVFEIMRFYFSKVNAIVLRGEDKNEDGFFFFFLESLEQYENNRITE